MLRDVTDSWGPLQQVMMQKREYAYDYVHGVKGKEKKSIYTAPFIQRIISKCSHMDHTVLPANYTMPAFPS